MCEDIFGYVSNWYPFTIIFLLHVYRWSYLLKQLQGIPITNIFLIKCIY